MKIPNRILIIIRTIIGLSFLASAFLKLYSIDTFEIYVYRLGFFNLNLSIILARLLISIELLLGLLLILQLYAKIVWKTTLTLVIVFTLFLIYQLIQNQSENCHCFGDLIKISPLESLYKNLGLLILLFLIRKQKRKAIRSAKIIIPAIIIVGITIPPVISPPDFIHMKKYEGISRVIQADNNETFRMLITENHFDKGQNILCFFSMGCRYCKLASQKLSRMAEQNNKDISIHYIFFGKKESLDRFWKNNPATKYPSIIIDTHTFFRISNGHLPLIVFMEDGKILNTFGYRDLTEDSWDVFINK